MSLRTKAVTLRVPSESLANGVVRPGSFVDVGFFPKNANDRRVPRIILRSLRVHSIKTNFPRDDHESNRNMAQVTVETSPEETPRLAFAAERGEFRLFPAIVRQPNSFHQSSDLSPIQPGK
jgi:Flp pilus assembly protein CpaB